MLLATFVSVVAQISNVIDTISIVQHRVVLLPIHPASPDSEANRLVVGVTVPPRSEMIVSVEKFLLNDALGPPSSDIVPGKCRNGDVRMLRIRAAAAAAA